MPGYLQGARGGGGFPVPQFPPPVIEKGKGNTLLGGGEHGLPLGCWDGPGLIPTSVPRVALLAAPAAGLSHGTESSG